MKIRAALTVYISLFLMLLIFNLVVRMGTYTQYFNDRLNYRQGDTYAMAYNLYAGNTDIWHPRYFQAQENLNLEHYFLAEFPFYQIILSTMFRIFGESVVYARIVNVFFITVTSFGIFLMGEKMFGRKTGAIAGFVTVFFPLPFSGAEPSHRIYWRLQHLYSRWLCCCIKNTPEVHCFCPGFCWLSLF